MLKSSLGLRSGPLATIRHPSSLVKQSRRRIHIHYEEVKNGEVSSDHNPILIAHGMLGSSSNWSSVAKRISFETKRRVVTFDARNHGRSGHVESMSYNDMKQDVLTLLKHKLNIDKATLMGHSMGGRTFMWTALNNPEVVANLIVVDISPRNHQQEDHQGILESMLEVKFLQNVSIAKARKDAGAQLGKTIDLPAIRDWLLMNMGETHNGEIGWRSNIQGVYNNYLQGAFKFPAVGNRKYEGNCVFIGGSMSPYIPKSDHKDILKIFPGAKFEYVENAGHWVHSEKPEEFLKVALKYLERYV